MRVEARRCVQAHCSRPGTGAELQPLLIWPFLIFSSLSTHEALINFYFNLLGALSQLTVVLIIVAFGQWERCFLTRLCCLKVLPKIHKVNNGPPTRRIHVGPHSFCHTQPVFRLCHLHADKFGVSHPNLIYVELFSALTEQLKGEHVCLLPLTDRKSGDHAEVSVQDPPRHVRPYLRLVCGASFHFCPPSPWRLPGRVIIFVSHSPSAVTGVLLWRKQSLQKEMKVVSR